MYSGKKHNYKTFPFKALSPLSLETVPSHSPHAQAHVVAALVREQKPTVLSSSFLKT